VSGKSGFHLDIPGQVLEFVNGSLFIVCVGMMLFIGWYLLARLTVYRFRVRPFIHSSETKLALALLVFALGDAVIRGPIWYWRHLLNHHGDSAATEMTDLFTFIVTDGAVLCLVSGIVVIRLMVSYKLGEWPWLAVAVLAIMFSFVMM
jgi:hypothetical protein